MGLLGLASLGYLVVAGRALGPERFAPVAIYWTMLHTVGAGLFLPIEQHVSRELSAVRHTRHDPRQVLARAAVVAGGGVLALLVASALGFDVLAEAFFQGSPVLVLALLTGVAAMAGSYWARGMFAGLGRWRRYGWQLGIDGLVRLGGACLLALAGSDSVAAYAFVIVIALVVSTVATVVGSPRPASGGTASPWRGDMSALTWLFVASVSGLSLLNAAPLAVQLLPDRAGSAAVVGNFVAALTLTRIPLFLFSAVQASLLPALVTQAGEADESGFMRTLRRLTFRVVALGLCSGTLLLAFGTSVLRSLFGQDFRADPVDLALLALATAGLMLVTTFGQALVALSHYRAAAVAPLLGVAVFLAIVAASDEGLPRRVSLALLLAVLATTATLALQLRASIQGWTRARAV